MSTGIIDFLSNSKKTALGLVASTTLLGITISEFNNSPVTHITAWDKSESSLNSLSEYMKHHCQATIVNTISDDKFIPLEFADTFSKTGSSARITNPFTDNICNPENIEVSSNIGRHKGTSLTQGLIGIDTVITQERQNGNNDGIFVSVLIDTNEPVKDKTDDLKAVESILNQITEKQALVHIIGNDAYLKNTLTKIANTNPNVTVCSLQEVTYCISTGYEKARKLHLGNK